MATYTYNTAEIRLIVCKASEQINTDYEFGLE